MSKEYDPRHEARRVALAALFERSFHSIDQESSTRRVLEVYDEGEVDRDLLNLILQGVVANTEALDKIIAETAPAWPPDQITKIDLIALRIAVFELVVAKNVPPKVAIDEAIELAMRGKAQRAVAPGALLHGLAEGGRKDKAALLARGRVSLAVISSKSRHVPAIPFCPVQRAPRDALRDNETRPPCPGRRHAEPVRRPHQSNAKQTGISDGPR